MGGIFSLPEIIEKDVIEILKFAEQRGFEFTFQASDKIYVLLENGENIVSKLSIDVISTIQLMIIATVIPVMYFIYKSDTNKITDTIIEPSKAVQSIVNKIP